MKSITPVLLLILDGFGHRTEGDDNAILHANMPTWNRLRQRYAYGTINASENFVGLPSGQFGNSEVGHLNIGAGRIVQQDISRIDCDIEDGHFANNDTLQQAMSKAQGSALHILGLLSDGGVHSHENHIHALIRAAQAAGVAKIYVHAFLDGRDTPPRSAETFLKRLDAVLAECPNARLVSVTGRYWAMDRDKRWERVEPAYRLLVEGEGLFHAETGLEALAAAYERDENDEFVKATGIGAPVKMQDGDALIFMNFRADRARQLTTALTDPAFDGFQARQPKFGCYATLTSYGEAYSALPTAYAPQKIHNGMGEYLSSQGLKQLRIAETEKYPHVTYFFNGGEEQVYPGEDRILVPSPKVATYDLQPEMSAGEVTDKIVAAIQSGQYQAIFCNYANGDMVGHSGIFDAAVKAVEALDGCIERCVDAMLAAGGEVLITADHGNCEQMYDGAHHQPHTQHTTNQVPFLYIGRPATIRGGGSLRDISPSLLAMMGLEQPAEMTGQSLIDFQ
ncbi:2,3-bisphosphoglycerate-independent phosphoglycerate mutase [Chromobacterium subtsugae]|uniref:2,3-bisphosphoglycerate-independent phosphoglycerate mutase n=1 Tax=Chromobacterium subtsugae TaxID=251747 RepID=A0ABS7FCJ1_9NEIS|nr:MULTISPECIES: 2,3-bisphosphoglycerate-independent phosphoglycerate mutase [Chromobacterium]KUM04564.1 2,3-bisphosphoglycerate-independent phosphoglycerate mutase [Chromobacterium subtsugae]KZE87133.1 2,3-bisphosphoglycerate-independent phosphoglycerate mutase [Chromobacterium sp. F49]MBW7565922.1 2,3-bisphosphoglycerate-independent phosphoglycerate mutase [Chromobacterium subtsugae]MBW8287038.1 2,3-bisphosphoglycerate-independent phosphoglycerate mutase [Chromobacterium subtsugae]OBU88194.1